MKSYFIPRRILPLTKWVALVVLSGCATTVNVTGQFPARYQAAADLRRIAVAGFQGPGGNAFASALETELASARLDGKPYFTLVGGGARGSADAISARAYGRSVGATGVYFGNIREQVRGGMVQATQTQCTRWENNACKHWDQVLVNCEQRTVTVSVTPKLLNVATGEIVYTAEKSGQTQTTRCPGAAAQSNLDMVVAVQRGILRDIHMDVAPNAQIVQAKVMDDASGLNDALAGAFDEAAKQMKAGNVQHACETWSKIHEAASPHVPTVFNLGVCAETAGHYQEALKLYEQAGDLLAHPKTSTEDKQGLTGWLRSAAANAQNMVSRADEDIAAAKARVTRLIAARSQLTAIEQARNAELERKRQEAEALERQRAEEAARQRREAAAAQAREEARVAAARQQEQARAAAAKRQQAQLAAERKRELIARFGEVEATAILKGEVKMGMSKDAVIASIGKPLRHQEASASEEMWSYPSQQVIFTNGKVTYVGH